MLRENSTWVHVYSLFDCSFFLRGGGGGGGYWWMRKVVAVEFADQAAPCLLTTRLVKSGAVPIEKSDEKIKRN